MVRSSFFEYNVALTGLHVARGGLQTTGHNIANAATVGYSRQYVEQRASTPLSYGNGKGMFGTGSEIYGVGQWRNFYLDSKFRAERAVLGEYMTKRAHLGVLEGVFNEMSDSGTSTNFVNFFQKLQDLSTVAGNPTYRTNVTQAAQELAKFVNATAESLKNQQVDINEEVRTVVQTINTLGHQIRSLNEQISKFEMDGSQANDLRDQRALLLDELSLYVNIEVKEVETNEDYAKGLYPDPSERCLSRKELTVMINGYEFIKNWDVMPLRVVPREVKTHTMDVPNLYDVYFEGSGVKFDIYSPSLQGQLKGLIDVRDGNNGYHLTTATQGTISFTATQITVTNPTRVDLERTGGYVTVIDPESNLPVNYKYTSMTLNGDGSLTFTIDSSTPILARHLANPPTNLSVGQTSSFKGIPHYMDRLNELVRTFSRAINEGKDRNGDPIPGVIGHMDGYDAENQQTGIPFFTYGNGADAITGAIDYFSMTCENFQVNQAIVEDPRLLGSAEEENAGIDDNRVIHGFFKIQNYESLFAEGKLEDFIIGTTSELGIDGKQALNFEKNYTDITTSIDNQRISVSGVDLNEEFTNLMKYQQLYMSCARLMNVINNIYDVTINRMAV